MDTGQAIKAIAPLANATDARNSYNSYISGLHGNPGQTNYNDAASYAGNTYGQYISPQEYLGALGQIYPSTGATTPTATPKGSVVNTGPGSSTFADAVRQQAAQQIANLPGAEKASLDTQTTGLNSSILDAITAAQQGQSKVNQEYVQNDLAKRVGTQGVLDMINHGIQSGGVILANKNASESSAGDALARAYGILGRQQLSGVGNQFAQANAATGIDQTNLNIANATNARKAGEQKTQIVNGIVQDATNQINTINASMAYASLPDRIDMASKIQEIRQAALDQLGQYDQTLSQGLAGVTPISADQAQANAAQLQTAGTAPTNAFQFSTVQAPQFQGTGPSASSLPLFTFPGNKKAAA